MVLSDKGYQTFGKTDKSDAECALIYDRLDGVVGTKRVGSVPQTRHQERELLGKSRFLKVITVAQLPGGHVKYLVEFAEEAVYPLFLVLYAHQLDGNAHYIDCGE